MTELQLILNRLEKQEKKIDAGFTKIECAIKNAAVQGEKIHHMEENIDMLWKKYDGMNDPESGSIPKLQRFNESCPRKQVNWIWFFLIGTMGTATTAALVYGVMK